MFLASIRNIKWLRNIKKSNAGKTWRYFLHGLRVKKFELKLEALTGEVLLRAFSNFAKFRVKHLFQIKSQA